MSGSRTKRKRSVDIAHGVFGIRWLLKVSGPYRGFRSPWELVRLVEAGRLGRNFVVSPGMRRDRKIIAAPGIRRPSRILAIHA